MKKFLVILLLLVYGSATSGMTLHFHYCCGKLKKVELKPVEKDGCGMGLHKDGKKCCESKSFELKVKSDQKTEASFVKSFKAPLALASFSEEKAGISRSIPGLIYSSSTSPPIQDLPLFIRNCVYRI